MADGFVIITQYKMRNYKIFLWPLLVLILHIFATVTGLYDKFAWFDIPMHLLGGASVALSAFFILKRSDPLPLWVTMALMIGGASIMAIGWEWFEFILDHYAHTVTQLGLFDTLKDLYDGVSGATIVAIIMMVKTLRKK